MVDRAAEAAQKTIALALVLPLLRQQLRDLVESCSDPVITLGSAELTFRRGTLSAEDEAWVRPWREAVAAVEAALGRGAGPEDGGIKYVSERGDLADEH